MDLSLSDHGPYSLVFQIMDLSLSDHGP